MEGTDTGICKLCFETFDEKIRPRCLYCGHSFCSSCISDLIKNEELVCPTCKQRHRAVNVKSFPINYDLEENISSCKRVQSCAGTPDELSNKSNKLQTLIDEEKASAQNLLSVSRDLQSQIKEYDDLLLAKKRKHNEVLQKVNDLINRNRVNIKQIDEERKKLTEMQKEVNVLRKGLKDQLPSLNTATSIKSVIVAIDELDQNFAALEEWNKCCQQQLPNAKLILSSDKVLSETMAAISMMDGECDEDILEVPDLSKTDFTILEKIERICKNDILTLEKLQNMSQPLKTLIERGRVNAIQPDKGNGRFAKLSFKDNKIYLHYLQDGEPPAHVHTIKQSELLRLLKVDSTEVFMDFAWEGSVKGRVNIILSPDTPFGRQFRILCTGELGPSYAHSKFIDVFFKGDPVGEYLRGGDYEYNNGTGGSSIIEGLEKDDGLRLYHHPYTEGSVGIHFTTMDRRSAQFFISTGKGKPDTFINCKYGQVQSGLDVVRAAVQVIDTCSVEIIDCGVVVPL